jgi:hypothetical protein
MFCLHRCFIPGAMKVHARAFLDRDSRCGGGIR